MDWDLRAPEAEYLTITTTSCDSDHALLTVAGELDLISRAEFEHVVAYHLRRGRRFVTADIRGLTFIDAAGVGSFVRAHQSFLALHGRLLFRQVPHRVMRVLELVGLADELFLLDGEHRSFGIAT
jgi:anti-anti-sigma factor